VNLNIRVLKALVYGMGALIVVGVIALVVVMAARMGKTAAPPPFPPSSREAVPFEFGNSRIDLPRGASVAGVTSAGDFLAVETALTDGTRTLLIIDPRTGRKTGTIELHPGNGPN